jgi:two-component system, cell cycle sensor histidine kinase and response regulator CckA
MAERHENEDWQVTFDGINDGICFLSADQKILRCNRYLTELLKKPASELIGRYCFEVVHKTTCPVEGCPVAKTKRTLRRENMDLQMGERWYHVTADPILDGSGALEGILHIVRDITETWKIKEVLRESEERFRRVFNQGPVAIAILNRDFQFTEVNPAFCTMLGFSEQEFLKRTFIDITHPEHLEADLDNVARLVRGESPFYQTEKRYVAKNGRIIWGSITLSVMRDNEGKFLHFLAIIKDITDRKKTEDEVLRSQKLEALGVLAGGIAHDFNNLLAGVFGFLDLARESIDPGHRAAGYLRNAFLAFERAKALSRQLLTFAKGGAPVTYPVSVDGILRESCNLAMSGSNVNCTFALEENLAVVEADENQLSQAFSNILINARQAMPGGGTVAVSAENRTLKEKSGIPLPKGEYVAIVIRDEGIGIPENIIGRIFDPFFSTKQQGSGLGLATTYSIIKRHGGHIEAASAPGKGTVITILLPASARAIPASDAVAEDILALLRGSGRVLVMDDEKDIRDITAKVLTEAGYTVVAVPEGRIAVERYREAFAAREPFSLVILDLTVPGGMGGEKAIAELQKIDPGVVAVVSSGYSENAILNDPNAYGFAGKIAKPYRTLELLRVVKKTLGK